MGPPCMHAQKKTILFSEPSSASVAGTSSNYDSSVTFNSANNITTPTNNSSTLLSYCTDADTNSAAQFSAVNTSNCDQSSNRSIAEGNSTARSSVFSSVSGAKTSSDANTEYTRNPETVIVMEDSSEEAVAHVVINMEDEDSERSRQDTTANNITVKDKFCDTVSVRKSSSTSELPEQRYVL